MDTETKRKCIKQFSSLVQLPLNYCEKTDDTVKVSYHIHGKDHEGIITDPFEIADIMKYLNKIDHYHPMPGSVRMQKTVFTTRVGVKGQPVMYGIAQTRTLAEMEITREDAIVIASFDYWAKAACQMHAPQQAKIINMYSGVIKRIA